MKKTKAKKLDTFDVMNVTSKEQSELLCAHLEALKLSMGWKILKENNDANIAVLTEMILSKRDAESTAMLTEPALDRARDRRSYLLELNEMPDRLIATFKVKAGTPVPDFDPYAKSTRSERGRESSKTLEE